MKRTRTKYVVLTTGLLLFAMSGSVAAQEYCVPRVIEESSWGSCGSVDVEIAIVGGSCLVGPGSPTTDVTIRVTWSGVGCGSYPFSWFEGFRSLRRVSSGKKTIASGIVISSTPVQQFTRVHEQTYTLENGTHHIYAWGDTDQGESAGASQKIEFDITFVTDCCSKTTREKRPR